MPVSKRLRFEILRRDNHQCRYCGGTTPEVKLSVDHVVPVTLGGGDDPSNLVAACVDCNAGKSAANPDAAVVSEVNDRALQWAGAMAIVAAERHAERVTRARQYRSFKRHWDGFKGDGFRGRQHQSLPNAWESSLDQLIAAGLEIDDLKELAGIAMSHTTVTDKWRYFCGCCWSRVKENTERAVQIVAPEPVLNGLAGIDWENADDWLVHEFKRAERHMSADYGLVLPNCRCEGEGKEDCGKRECVAFIAGFAIGKWASDQGRAAAQPEVPGVPDALV
ncbi:MULTISPECIES: HNH endonuclease [unclassified Rhodococcus (in: high G+C Gram-positive bacteria)]|uniref:HNH endonuclease n=1 Tax=unclassified Rhodococcus (in: high G+C Gram-positive bacteria) TaxID=192944 RepID=UPI000B9C492E|nr:MULTISPECIES: HNH endonuclease [unclassified Rhodococcus (in: high G+C Gram-positive bacteria)]OZE35645.1 hypothetical protein CH259_16595 [Rhodococcus sp. 05-2254-4]OZE48074.1 hypothetical protein CH261_09190 [Rhodococcus sp. 05-2254-3]OZE49285.1 hypothetical protein CH283_16975 [Rhodococcus sp. 05-2254-2]